MDSSSASNQSLAATDDYIMLDPRAPRHAAPSASGGRGKRMMFNEGVVFMVGGAGYVEYGNLQEWATRMGKKVTYGGTEIMDPTMFTDVLARLGKSS